MPGINGIKGCLEDYILLLLLLLLLFWYMYVWLAEHYSTEICKNAKYSAQVIGKWQGNSRNSRGAIGLGEAVLRRKGETKWMLKLRTVYPYGLNEKMDICEDDKNIKWFKSDDGIVWKLFPSLLKLF